MMGSAAMDEITVVAAPGGNGEKPVQVFILKVLAGRHAGASMRLKQRAYSIGSDEMCDFIFHDEGFANGSLTLDLSGEMPTLTVPEGVSAQIGGKPIERPSLVLGRYEPVSVGATHFAIGPADEAWPEGETVAVVPPAAPESLAGPTSDAPEMPPSALPDDRAVPEYLHWGPAAPPPRIDPEPFLRKHRNALALAGVAVFVFLMFWFSRSEPEPGPSLAVQIRMLADSLHAADIVISGEPPDLRVTGQVATDGLRDSLLAGLAALSPGMTSNVLSAERLALGVRDFLDMYNMELAVEILPVGVVVLRGVYDDRRRLNEIVETVAHEVVGVAVVKDSVLSTSGIYSFLTETLTQNKLAHKVRFEAENGALSGLLVKDKMSREEMDAWDKVKTLVRSAYGLEMGEKWTDKLSPMMLKSASASRELDTDLMAVGVGPLNYLKMSGGKKYFEGTKLKSGHIIKSIQKDRIILEMGGVEDIYYLEGGVK